MNRGKVQISLLASAAMMAFSGSAYAQAQAQAGADDVDENVIIVTAQNRRQDVNDVPIKIDVISGEQLKKIGFSDMNDVGKIAPIVQINQDQGTVKVTVRGIGTNSADEAQDTSVVVNVDGEYINRPNVMGMALFDMDRVEVLRGPQGTLYGRNSTGGAINFITRKPGNQFGFNGTVSYGNYNAVRADAGVDLPLGSTAAFRVAGFYEDRDGYNKHPAGGGFFVFPAYAAGRSDDNQAYGGRVSLRLDPTDQLSVNLGGEYAKRRFTPGVFAAGDLNAAGNGPTSGQCDNGFTSVAPNYPQVLCVPSQTNLLSKVDRSNYAAPLFGIGRVSAETWAVRGRIAYEFSEAATLTYIGGYRKYIGGKNERLTLPTVYQSYTFLDDAETQSHELRLNGTVGGIVYQVGGFYFKEKLARESAFMLPSFIFGLPPFGANGPTPGTFLSYFSRDVDSTSKSLFGQVEVPLGDKLTAVGGLRYTKNDRSAIYINTSPFGRFGPDFGLVGAGPARKDFSKLLYVTTLPLGSSDSKVTWLAGLNYKPNSDTLIFAKASTGFKGGGFDAVGTYRPETNTAFEAGWKQTFGDHGQHQFNLGGFYYDYKDLQVSVLLDTAIGGQIFNAGKAKIWGLEASADIALDDNTTFHTSANYLNAQYKELFAQFNVFCTPAAGQAAATCNGINGVGDLDPTAPDIQQPNFAGNTPPFSPKVIITVGLDHVFHIGESTLTARADSVFKSKYFTDFYNYRDGTQEALTQSNLSLEFQPGNKKFSVMGFVRNLEGTRPLTYGSFISAGPDDIFNWQFGAPRTYGVRVSVNF
ncbi:TonB-dependent receptor [Novosphingobium cyanobacteriorum]|uniref:TonB-dependent receptor n=1 Tax=Novosphingobium cyanobacteriorum TaxID=3024215 RepID=A0ABT6CL40_9SPHN|nr:TonB-dependent receptor [Novosphingobium cyanobacteriorum]MDF8333795.1 TonB-dependent receptor [Novosphingobium cyanobacteriorum]